MAKLFQNKYRNGTFRLQSWDYSSEGMYFITICTKNSEPYLAADVNDTLQLKEIGKIAESEWFKTAEIRPDMNLELGAFVVMPDHIHGIIIIGSNDYNTPENGGCRSAMYRGPTTGDATGGATVATDPKMPKNKFGPQRKNLGSIIRGYKSAVTTEARRKDIEFNWQNLFYEHIIRSQSDYLRISEYIDSNPEKLSASKKFN